MNSCGEGYPIRVLGDLAGLTMGQSPDSSFVNSEEAGLPFLQGCAEFGARSPSPRLHCSPPLRIAKAGSTLISVRAPVGTTNRADQDYCIGRGLGAVLAKPGVADDIFLLHAIEANLDYLHRRSQCSTFLAIGSKELFSLPVPAPGIAAQRRIAEILSTLDEAIDLTEAMIAKMQQVKAGLMHDLFTRGVTPDGHLRPTPEQAPELYKESPLGWIPKEWVYGVLDDFSEIHNNLRKPISSEVREAMQGDYPYYGPTGVIDYINEFLVEGEYCLIGEDGDHFLKFVEWSMTILVNGRFNVNNHAHILSGRNGATTRWLHAFFQHRDITFHLTRQGAGRYKLNKAALKALPLCVPGSVEQQIILDRLGVAHSSTENQSKQLAKLHQQKQGLMHDLLTGQVLVSVANEKDVSTNAQVSFSS